MRLNQKNKVCQFSGVENAEGDEPVIGNLRDWYPGGRGEGWTDRRGGIPPGASTAERLIHTKGYLASFSTRLAVESEAVFILCME